MSAIEEARHQAQAKGRKRADYERSVAIVVEHAAEICSTADLVVKVKEPQSSEIALIREGQLVFTYFTSPQARR